MSNLRRYFRPNDTVFVTCVTVDRVLILVDNIDLLQDSINSVMSKTPFNLLAWVVLPDHFHLIVGDSSVDPSAIIRDIKLSFSARYRKRLNVRAGTVWQKRFWDHIIRDHEDLNRHVDYIHFNPVKHGLVERAIDWKHSSVHEYIARGDYSMKSQMTEVFAGDQGFGE